MKTKIAKSQNCHILTILGVFVSMQAAMIHMTYATSLPSIVETVARPLETLLAPLDTSTQRVARRMSNRIRTHLDTDIAASKLATSVQGRRALMKRSATVRLISNDSNHPLDAVWSINLQAYPQWVQFDTSRQGNMFSLKTQSIAESLSVELDLRGIPRAQHALVTRTYPDHKITRVEIDQRPADGFVVDVIRLSESIASALENGQEELIVALDFALGTMIYPSAEGPQTLVHLSTGKSEFSHSPYGRIKNVHKVINEKINGAIAPVNQEFSFNSMLGGPVTHANGWLDSLVIVNGRDLVPEAGGGICQGATTTMRAAVLAGLPLVKRINHSLYVFHYKQYGLGIDATVYPGKQDLVFKNDTPGDLVFVGHTIGEEAFVEVYGVPDGRTVQLEGPFFASTAPEGFTVNSRSLAGNQIGWSNTVIYGSGSIRSEKIVSTYREMPRSLVKEYPVSRGIAELLGTPPREPPVAMEQQTIAAAQ